MLPLLEPGFHDRSDSNRTDKVQSSRSRTTVSNSDQSATLRSFLPLSLVSLLSRIRHRITRTPFCQVQSRLPCIRNILQHLRFLSEMCMYSSYDHNHSPFSFTLYDVRLVALQSSRLAHPLSTSTPPHWISWPYQIWPSFLFDRSLTLNFIALAHQVDVYIWCRCFVVSLAIILVSPFYVVSRISKAGL